MVRLQIRERERIPSVFISKLSLGTGSLSGSGLHLLASMETELSVCDLFFIVFNRVAI